MNRIIEYYNLVSNLYKQNFWKSKEAVDYMVGRGISKKILDEMNIGYAPSNNCLPITDVPEFVIKESNLFYEDMGNVFFKSIIFPCFVGNNCVFFSSRKLDKYVNDKKKKHLHLKGKIDFVYNQNIINQRKRIFISEGCIDTLTLLTHGRASVGMLGANRINDEIARCFKDKIVFILFDSDENGAGQNAAIKTAGVLTRNGIDARIVFLPSNGHSYDINNFLLNHPIEELDYIVRYAVPFYKTEEYLEGKFNVKNQVKGSTIPLTKVISHYNLKIIQKNGNGFKIHCPFPDHKDDTASMQIYLKTNSFCCFGCSIGGSSVTFIMRMEKCSRKQAYEILEKL